ncbi:MAG: hypothetical protein NVS1B13_05080 [Flavisolibacter sp.]
MKKLLSVLTILVSISVGGQTLFYYGQDSVSVSEFLKAYYKNNTGLRNQQVFSDYLQLYINSRLKIKEARERHYDTLSQIHTELENLRQQIMPTYLSDKATTSRLVEEALQRSQKDIHLAHLFIGFSTSGTYDTTRAYHKLKQVLEALSRQEAFSKIAKQYSEDSSAGTNGGDLGYITVFSLPYPLENLAYSTKVGQISAPYHSIAGYHIFKNLGERRDVGKLKAAQILLAFPGDADEKTKSITKKTADSLYLRLQKGDDFGKLAAQFSNDLQSAGAGGQMPDIVVGQYDSIFERTAYSLPLDGSFSRPVLESDGYHIIKRLSKMEAYKRGDVKSLELLKARVEQSDRMNTQKTALAHKILNKAGYKQHPFSYSELWSFSDSIINYIKPQTPLSLTTKTILFSIGEQPMHVAEWITYAQTFRYKADGSGVKPYLQIWNEFVETTALDYYQKHLEQYNEDFRAQLNEFKEGNLFFEIMQRQIWGPVQTDTAALLQYYQSYRQRYNWKASADAVIFYSSDQATATIFMAQLKKNPAQWHNLVSRFSEKIAADSSRFEWQQLPNGSRQALKPGTITAPLLNKTDHTLSFAYIIRLHQNTEPRNYNDAKGLVMNDYQNSVEKNWIDSLKTKYPVRINDKKWKELINKKKY